MPWHNRRNAEQEVHNGDKPYGNYWEQIPDCSDDGQQYVASRTQNPDGSWSFVECLLTVRAKRVF